jgi:hypothetical protein
MMYLLVWLVIVGVVLWLVNTYVPMQPQVKTIMNVVVIVLLILWLAQQMVGFPALPHR